MITQYKRHMGTAIISAMVIALSVLGGLIASAKANSLPLAPAQDNSSIREAYDNLNKGFHAFGEHKYDEAAQFMQKAVELDPNFETARLYLATVYTSQFVPGSTDPKSEEAAYKAIETFRYLAENAHGQNQKTAMLSIASLFYQLRKNAESMEWCKSILKLYPQSAEAYYRIATIAFDTSLQKTGFQGELVDSMSSEQRTSVQAIIDEGLEYLEKALEIWPDYFDAMEYQNLLLREKAKLVKDGGQS